MATDEQLDTFATWERESWQARAAAYGEHIVAYTAPAAEPLLDAAAVPAAAGGVRVLDVATGPGTVAAAALRRGASVTAVDQSEAMLDQLRVRLPDVRAVLAPVEQLGLPDASQDAVVAGFLLNHLARPALGIAELARVLRPGGRLALSVWDLPSANRATGLLGELLAASGVVSDVPAGPDSTLFADRSRFAALLTDAGLVDVRVEPASWRHVVDPGAWFDAVAAGMPRSGAVVAAAPAGRRAELRAAYVDAALAEHGDGAGHAVLPAAAVIASARRPASR